MIKAKPFTFRVMLSMGRWTSDRGPTGKYGNMSIRLSMKKKSVSCPVGGQIFFFFRWGGGGGGSVK